jgi:hypothetical protein
LGRRFPGVSPERLRELPRRGGGQIANPHARELELLTRAIPWAGIFSLLGLLATVLAALLTIGRLWSALDIDHPVRLQKLGAPQLRLAGLLGPILVPTVFLCTWVLLLIDP